MLLPAPALVEPERQFALSITVETIDPETARQYLDTMRFNRPLDLVRVKQYAKEMQAGLWRDLSRYIEFTEEGDLINGQHRLHAVIESGMPQRFAIVRGLPVSAR